MKLGEVMTTCPQCKKTKVRSDEEHSLLFGVIGLAFENWPHAHRFKPHDAEHLRAWLAIEVGHAENFEVPDVLGIDPQSISRIGMFFCGGKRHFRLGHAGERLVIWRPLTMNKRDIGVVQFRAMADAIYEVIEQITGITPEHYKRQQREKHARAA